MAQATETARSQQRASATSSAAAQTLSKRDSTQIDALRVFCIFLMLSVHVPPFTNEGTIFESGSWFVVWFVYVDLLARASVAVLSFLAGYLLWLQGRQRPFGDVARSRFQTLIVPMVTWNLIHAVLTAALVLLQGRDISSELARYDVDHPVGAISALTGLAHQPINLPLSFLRDLFVSVLAARALVAWLPKYGIHMLAALLFLALFDLGQPIVLRPSIPLFVFAGAVAAARGFSLEAMSGSRLALPVASLFALAFAAAHMLPAMESALDEEAVNLAKRMMLVAILLFLGRAAAKRIGSISLASVRPILFLAFVTHLITTQLLGEVWAMLRLGTDARAYAAFFFLNAPIAVAVAWVGTVLIDRMARSAQIMLRGSVRSTQRRREAAASA